jgi:transcriptional regulatory protein RtcR
MSALFGHEKGAFTGAQSARAGLLKSADKGVLFLDEIGELGDDEQAMLLRAVEERTFLSVGADRPVTSEFQLIAGTNRDLSVETLRGRFRADLFSRINLWTFELPPLSERPEDIEPNFDYEVEQYMHRTQERISVAKEAREKFLRFATSRSATWNGNFRDLNSAVRRMATLCKGGRITVHEVEEEIARLTSLWNREGSNETMEDLPVAADSLDYFDAVQLREVVRVCRQSRSLSDAGRKLFAVSRENRKAPNDADRLRKYLLRFNLTWESVTEGRF